MTGAKKPAKGRPAIAEAGPVKQTSPTHPVNRMVSLSRSLVPYPEWCGGRCPDHLVQEIWLIRFSPDVPLEKADLPRRIYSLEAEFRGYEDASEQAQAQMLASEYEIALHEWDEWAELLWPVLDDWQRTLYQHARADAVHLRPLAGSARQKSTQVAAAFTVFERYFLLRRLVFTDLALQRAEYSRDGFFEHIQLERKAAAKRFLEDSVRKRGVVGRLAEVSDLELVYGFLADLRGGVLNAQPVGFAERGFVSTLAKRWRPGEDSEWLAKRLRRLAQTQSDSHKGAALDGLRCIAQHLGRFMRCETDDARYAMARQICKDLGLSLRERK